MEAKKYTSSQAKGKNVIKSFLYRYLPYWPLFVILVLLCSGIAYAYLKITAPVYEASATILIKDEKKGADETKILEALNIYSASKIVENETEVIQSKDLIRQVVDSLHLYASVFEDGPIVSYDAYTTSPVVVALQNPARLPDQDRFDFTYNKAKGVVAIGSKTYPLQAWVATPFGIARFSTNPNQKTKAARPLYFTFDSPDKVASRISRNLLVSASGKLSTVITLKLRDVVPQRAVNVLNTLIEDYNHAAVADKNILANNTLALVQARIKNVTEDLDSIENRLQTFRARKGVVNLSEQGKLYLQNVGDNDRTMTDLNMQLAMLGEVERYVQTTQKNKVGIVPSIAGIRDPLTTQMLQKLYDTQMQYERLRKTIPDDNPTMLALKSEIENMRPTILENIQNQRLSLQASRNNLSARSGSFTSMLQSIPQKEKELLEISRQQAIKNNAYAFLVQKREETAFAYAAAVPDSRTIEQANASPSPVSPNRNLVYELALAVALLIGIAVINAKEFLSNKVLFRADIENLTGIPIVAEVVKLKGKPSLINNTSKSSVFAEQFRQLRAALGLYSRHNAYKKLLVTSSIAGEGKSFISNNLALSLAISGRKAVLMDFDLRNPRTTAMHNMTGNRGLVSFLEDSNQPINEIIYPTEQHPKLFVLPAGASQGTQSNPTELLINGDLKKLFSYIESNFDFIIVDTSPVDPVTDAYVLAEYCEATLFVIRHAFTPKAMVQVLEEYHKNMALKNISIVFNAIKPRGLFSRKYGSEYGFGRATVYGEETYRGKGINTNA